MTDESASLSLNEVQAITEAVRATREHPAVTPGVSPRGTLALYRASSAYAAMQGRDYVQPDDVKRLAPGVLAHRLLTHGMRQGGKDLPATGVIRTTLEQLPVPR